MSQVQQSIFPRREPASSEELVDAIGRLVREHYQRTGKPLDGAFLSYLIRQEFPSLDYAKLGITRLGDAVRLAVAKHLVSRSTLVKHLELRPYVAAQDAAVAEPEPKRSTEVRFVRPDLWKVAVLSPRAGHFFVHKGTGELVSAHETDLPRMRVDPEFVEVEPVTDAVQRTWLKEYLASKGQPIAVDDDTLDQQVRGGIRTLGSALVNDWKLVRSRRAVEHVRQWAARGGIPEGLVLKTPDRDARRARATVGADAVNAEPDLRKAVMAVLGEMTLKELEDVWVPLRHVLRHFTVK